MRLAGFGTAAAAPATKRRRNQSKLLDILFYSHFFFLVGWFVCFLRTTWGIIPGCLTSLNLGFVFPPLCVVCGR